MGGVRASKTLKLERFGLGYIGQLGWWSENWDKGAWGKGAYSGQDWRNPRVYEPLMKIN